MDCDRCRAAISASLDGEDPGLPEEVVRAHVDGCADCRRFASGAEALHRTARVAPATPVPDLTDAILRSIGDEPVVVERDDRTDFLRLALAIVAVIQLTMAIPALVLGDDAGLPTHVARHLGSFALALGVGLLFVAWKPERAAGLLPVVAAVVICLVGSSVLDIVQGRAAPGAEVSHATELVGLVAVWLLARTHDPVTPRDHRPVLG
jgi:predicted anti-sigma-YlaC factor YlaD